MGLTEEKPQICAVILAGGAATRMGGVDKGLVAFKDKTLVETVIDAIEPQVDKIVVSANRSLENYRALGFDVVTDKMQGYPGPLVGIMSAMSVTDADLFVTAPCDSPYVGKDYVRKLYQAFVDNPSLRCAAAVSQGYKQPVFMMIRKETEKDIETFLAKGEHRVRGWLESMHVQWVEFDDLSEFDNFNTMEELQSSVLQRQK